MPQKAQRVLFGILIIMLLILVRIWFLAIVQHDEKLSQSLKPQTRTVSIQASRGIIRDRFGIDLAVNRVHYDACIVYEDILSIPSVRWNTEAHGKRRRTRPRLDYVRQLAQFLAKELHLESQYIEDVIHARAAPFPRLPLVLAGKISESTYYRLKVLEKDWPGLHAVEKSTRHYPKGKVASHIIGTLGAINQEEFTGILDEIQRLRHFVRQSELGVPLKGPDVLLRPEEARTRLLELEAKAYGMTDLVGKSGVEAMFEEDLRGYHGKKQYLVDAKGRFLRKLPGSRKALSGQELRLSISADLQEFAERLLIQNEGIREGRSLRKGGQEQKQPWIKGGAIIAMEPNTGEILALASYPRFAPSDYVPTGNCQEMAEKKRSVLGWLESKSHIGALWDGKTDLHREALTSSGIEEEIQPLNLKQYLKMILPEDHPISRRLLGDFTLTEAVELTESMEALSENVPPLDLINVLFEDHRSYLDRLSHAEKKIIKKSLSKSSEPARKSLKRILSSFQTNYDKALFMDLCRILVDGRRFSKKLMATIGSQPVWEYRQISRAQSQLLGFLQNLIQELFHRYQFSDWRAKYGKKYLQIMRQEEERKGRWARPYLDYFEDMERRLFSLFWEDIKTECLIAFATGELSNRLKQPSLRPFSDLLARWEKELAKGMHREESWNTSYWIIRRELFSMVPKTGHEYLQSIREFKDLDRPLLGSYPNVYGKTEADLAAAFYPPYGYGYSRSYACQYAGPLGSIFKVVTGFEALSQHYKQSTSGNLNPLTIVDNTHKREGSKYWNVGMFSNGKPIPPIYKGGRMIRSLSRSIGPIDYLGAFERSSNPYFSLLAADVIQEPEDLNRAAREFSFGSPTGIDLPSEAAGSLPSDLSYNPSGLYAYAIGQHTLTASPLQVAVMLSAVANGGKVLKPKIASHLIGHELSWSKEHIFKRRHFLYRESLKLLGIDFPLFTAAEKSHCSSVIEKIPGQIQRQISIPGPVQNYLIEGMARATKRIQTAGRPALMNVYHKAPSAIRDFTALTGSLVGKTSTAETVERIDLDTSYGTDRYNHLWFGGIAFDKQPNPFIHERFRKADLVVVVHLRFGRMGNEAAPLAAQIIKKWREIKKQHN